VLDLKALGCRDPRAFPFLTPPPPSHMTAALLDLALLGATRPRRMPWLQRVNLMRR
jgi:HrpA-like RNA helicase